MFRHLALAAVLVCVIPPAAAGFLNSLSIPHPCARCDQAGDALYKYECPKSCHRVAPPTAPVLPFGNNRAFILTEPLRWRVGQTAEWITVPAGFVTDYASIPRPLWSLYSPHDQYSRAAVIHDYLYWTRQCLQSQADNLFLIAMKESAVPRVTQEAVYSAVHLAGHMSWDDNEKEARRGLPRFVPLNRRDFPPNMSWHEYRQRLVARTQPPETVRASKRPSYCKLGDGQEVPGGSSSSAPFPPLQGVVRSVR